MNNIEKKTTFNNASQRSRGNMAIEILPVGGFGEVGKQMVAVKVDNEVVIFDMGLHLPNYILATEGEEIRKISREQLMKAQAIPDDTLLGDWKGKVKAIVLSHAHLDHIGAVPFMASTYKAPIISAPFTCSVIRRICADEGIRIPNLKPLNPNDKLQICENLTIELIHITHSVPQSTVIALHTPHGIVVYANDFKLDNRPVLGKKPNTEALEALGKEGVAALMCECLYAQTPGKTPSETVAKEMLKDVLLHVNNKGSAVIVTTFSSHIARLTSIVECGQKLGRKVVFLGRSLSKYVEAAKEMGITDFKGIEIVYYPKEVAKKLKEIQAKGRDKYMIVCTGHQGEPGAVLSKMADGKLPFKFQPQDNIIFSCTTIPADINVKNRKILEDKLNSFGVRTFRDIHVSGHASREDLREFLTMLKPQVVCPSHGSKAMMTAFGELCKQLPFKTNVMTIINGQKIEV